MKKTITIIACAILALSLLLTSCKKTPVCNQQEDLKPIEHVGTVPEEFEKIISENLFYGVKAFADRLLVSHCVSIDDNAHTAEYVIDMMDLYGNVLASCPYKTGDTHRISTLTATRDGGFLFVSAFEDRAYEPNVWASDNGVTSHAVKCDKNGNIEWDASFDNYEGEALRFCFERDNMYYFFGDNQVPETKNRGVYSLTDIYMTVLSDEGELIQEKRLSGSDFDDLENAEIVSGGFLLSIRSQSDDGDFAGSKSGGYGVRWIFELGENLNIVDRKIAEGRDYFDDRLGEKNGVTIYASNQLFKEFDAGSPEAYIDYGDFYLIISAHATGVYEHTPKTISSIWYYRETVYSAYDQDGKLIFRSSVDSSPDYDSWVKEMTGVVFD